MSTLNLCFNHFVYSTAFYLLHARYLLLSIFQGKLDNNPIIPAWNSNPPHNCLLYSFKHPSLLKNLPAIQHVALPQNGLLASFKPIVNYLRCYQGLIHLYSTAAWRYLERRGVRKLEGQSRKNLLNRKLIKGAYKDRGAQWGCNHTVLKGQAGRFAQWGLWCPYNTSHLSAFNPW